MDHNQRVGKRVREDSVVSSSSLGIAAMNSPASLPMSVATSQAEITLARLPTVALTYIASFARGGKLSGACRSTLEAIPELHYRICIKDQAQRFSIATDPGGAMSSGHMGLQLTGALATGRVVTQVTVTGCTDYKDTQGGYQILEKAVQRVVKHSVPTLRSITVTGNRGKDSLRVSAIIGVLVPNSSKLHRVVPSLTRVELRHGANGVVKAGKAIAAGLWPALEELIVANCHGNTGHFSELSKALAVGLPPKLRVLSWDTQSCTEFGVDDLMLRAISDGKCLHIERISFTDNFYNSRSSQESLAGALQACPNLRELRMDCTSLPGKQLRDLTSALLDGLVPRLTSLIVRVRSCHRAADISASAIAENVKALKTAVASRSPPIHLEVS